MPSLNLRNPLRRDPNRPTLKQRAAALKATAGRLIRKPKAASSETAAEVVDWHNPPPGFMAFPAIEPTSFINIRIGIVAELERLRGIARAEYARREPCFRDSRFAEGELEAHLSALRNELRLSSLDAAIAGPNVQSGSASVAGPDPIFGAIEASRVAQTAVEEWGAAIEARASPPTEADFADEDRLTEAQSEARSRVIDTTPTTPAGRLALLGYLRWQMGLYSYTDGTPPDQGSPFWRFAYKALAAALAWDGAAPVSQHEADADAELIALGHAFDAATVRDREANDALDAAEDRAEPHMPERPATLIYREGDNLFHLREYGGAFAGIAVSPSDIEWMTRRPAQHEVWVDNPRAQPGVSMVPGKKPRIVHWPEAQARIDEIVTAWDAWHAEQDRALDEAGVTEARDTAADTSNAAAALARQIAAQPAHTVEGMRAKLRVAAFYCACDPDTPEGEGYPGEAAIRSLYRDTPGIEIRTDPSDVRIVPEA